MRYLALIAASLALIACSGGSSRTANNLDDDIGGEGIVEWQDYAPDLKSRINQLATAEDCAGLQEEFDAAEADDYATRSRTGHGNAELMTYIGDALESAGCN